MRPRLGKKGGSFSLVQGFTNLIKGLDKKKKHHKKHKHRVASHPHDFQRSGYTLLDLI